MGDSPRLHFLKDGFAFCGKRNCIKFTLDRAKVTCGYCLRKLMPDDVRPKQPNRHTMAKKGVS